MEIRTLASGSKGNCYMVSDGITSILIEAGIPFSAIRKGLSFKTSSISGCLLSHEHGDHSKAIPEVMKAGIDVFTSEGTAKVLKLSGHRLHTVRSLEQFVVGSWLILPFDTQHDCADPLGYLLVSGNEKLLYATDTEYIRYRFAGLTTIMCEVNYDLEIIRSNVANESIPLAQKNRVLKSHMSLETFLGFCKVNDLSKVQSIHLLHLSDGNSDAEVFKAAVQRATGKPVYIA